jgi:hypothetical protein
MKLSKANKFQFKAGSPAGEPTYEFESRMCEWPYANSATPSRNYPVGLKIKFSNKLMNILR